jgi:hypothetical protein
MPRTTPRLVVSCLLALLPLATNGALIGKSQAKSRDLVVEHPSDLPEQANVPGQSLFLDWDHAGSAYLYIEQQQGARLAVFDVTNPAKIKLAYTAPLNAPAAFDFVRPLNGQAELVRFRDGRGYATLDLHKAKSPALTMIGTAPGAGPAEPLGAGFLLVSSDSHAQPSALAQDYKVVDASDGAVIATVKSVTGKVVNSYTGTTFLLGSEGLSVIRRISVEDGYRMSMMQ